MLPVTLAAFSFAPTPSPAFVEVSADGTGFTLDGRPWHFVGVNFWHAMNLGAFDKQRLIAELDQLASSGITVLRMTAMTEGDPTSPMQVVPTLQPSAGNFDERLAEGMDFVLHEMGKRSMKALMVINNQWQWSGGFAQYRIWSAGKTWEVIPYPPAADPLYWNQYKQAHPGSTYDPEKANPSQSWDIFQAWACEFYSDKEARRLANAALEYIITRVNTLTGIRYSEDTTIFSWQLANEPRAVAIGDAEERAKTQEEALEWISSTSALIKSLAPRHLVSTGSEGITPYEDYVNLDYTRQNSFDTIDFCTVHCWVENWDWYKPATATEADFAWAMDQAFDYVTKHATLSTAIGKPLILEEFGLARDGGSFDPVSSDVRRRIYFAAMIRHAAGLGISGVVPWAWGGRGRPRVPGGFWLPGDDLLGDPPHERQGWYSVYDTDTDTLGMLKRGYDLVSTPDPPLPPSPPPAPPKSPPLPRSPATCTSDVTDPQERANDLDHPACESWCSDPTNHCPYCKCRGCSPLCDEYVPKNDPTK